MFAIRSLSARVTCGLLLAAGSLAPSDAAAQARSVPDPLRLDSLYAELRRSSPMLAASDAKAKAARSRAVGSGVLPDPQFQIGWMNYELPSLAPMAALGMTQLQLMQMIPVAGQLGITRRIADAKADAEDARAEDAWWEVRAKGAMLFHELYVVHGTLEVMRETLQLLEDVRSIAESMYRVGDGRQTDVLRAQVEIAKMSEDTVRMQFEGSAMTARLNALLARAADSPVGSPQLSAVPAAVPSPEALAERASTRRPAIAAAASESQAADQMSLLARREIYPDLQVGIQYGQRTSTMPDPLGGPLTMRELERMGSLMIGASVPIFAKRRQLQERQTADAMRQMAFADEAMLRAETAGAIGVAHADLMRARRLQDLYRTTILPQAEATVASALAAYRSGSVDFMTLLESRMAVNGFRQELIALEASEGRAWAELEMLVGSELLPGVSTP